MITASSNVTEAVREAAEPIVGAAADYDPLLRMVGDTRFVLLGEATHGTHEFYSQRAQITKRLIREKGFNAIAVEADWPDAYRVNRFVRDASEDFDAEESLTDFKRFPTWMWRNADVLDFIGWLREHNEHLSDHKKRVGFYGIDLYSLNRSVQAVLQYLDEHDATAAKRARERYGCFEHFGGDVTAYGYSAALDLTDSCQQQVLEELLDLRRRASDYLGRDGQVAADEYFFAEQNARLVTNAEEYYRSMFGPRDRSWNLRDEHMTGTLQALERHLAAQGLTPRIVVWEHNSHLGDARATQMGERGEFNVGQLVRERYINDSVLVGFTTHTGTVTAASAWDDPAERKHVRQSLPGSYEFIFHETGIERFFLNLREDTEATRLLRKPRLERAIGVIYLPQTERISHYFEARLADQFDAVFHFDSTRAVEPLERTAFWRKGEPAETFPFTV